MENTNTNDFGFLGNAKAEDVKNAGQKSTFPRLALVTVKQAVINKSENGTVTLDIKINELSPETKNIEKTYSLNTYFLTGKDGNQSQYHKDNTATINKLRFLLGVPENTNFSVKPNMSEVWDKEQKKMVEKPVNNLMDILGKPFWTVLTCYHKYPNKSVNGYSGHEITSYTTNPEQYRIEKDMPETIEVADYTKDTIVEIKWNEFYDFSTKQTLKEKLEGKEPKDYIEKLDYYEKKSEEGVFKAKQFSKEEVMEYRKKQLQKKLGKNFDNSRWESFNGKVATASNATPNW